MKKYWKWFAAFVAIGTAVGLVIAYFCKKRCKSDGIDEDLDFTDEEEDDFDLDVDLKPVSDREYVPLKKAAGTEAKAEEPKEASDAGESAAADEGSAEESDSAEEEDKTDSE